MEIKLFGYQINLTLTPPAKKRGPKGPWKAQCNLCGNKYKKTGLAIHKARCSKKT